MSFFSPHLFCVFLNLIPVRFFSKAFSGKKDFLPTFPTSRGHAPHFGSGFHGITQNSSNNGITQTQFDPSTLLLLFPCLWLSRASLFLICGAYRQLRLLDGTSACPHQPWHFPACPSIPPGMARQHSAPQFDLNFIYQQQMCFSYEYILYNIWNTFIPKKVFGFF